MEGVSKVFNFLNTFLVYKICIIPTHLSKYSKIIINILMGFKISCLVGVVFKNFKVTSGGDLKDFWRTSSLFKRVVYNNCTTET